MKIKRREWLQRIVEDLGLTQTQAAKMIGVDERAIRYWLSGQKTPELPNAIIAAEKLRFSRFGLDRTAFYEDSDIVLKKMRRIA